MDIITTLNSFNQITFPKPFLDFLNIKPGDKIRLRAIKDQDEFIVFVERINKISAEVPTA